MVRLFKKNVILYCYMVYAYSSLFFALQCITNKYDLVLELEVIAQLVEWLNVDLNYE